MTTPEVVRHGSPDDLAGDVADRMVTLLSTAQLQGRSPSVALTGGSVADRVHRSVTALAHQGPRVQWREVDWWFGDERFVASTSAERNANQARAAMLDHLPVDRGRVHEMPSPDERDDLAAAAAAYGERLRSRGPGEFDLVMLGVGADGHVASLFPGSPALDADAVAVGVPDAPKPPSRRITLTFAALARTREVWFVVAGEHKADAVRRALAAGADVHEVPACRPRGRHRTLWFLDEGAARAL